jgi:hypothetical protein
LPTTYNEYCPETATNLSQNKDDVHEDTEREQEREREGEKD